MSQKRAILRAAADQDAQAAIGFYLAEGVEQAASKFIDALEQAIRDIERHPGIGSTRYAHELDLPGLRSWQLRGYPHLLFYVEREDYVDIWRVLHGSRDIPSWLHTDE